MHVTTFSTGDKFRLVSNFTQLHTLTQVAHSYALLIKCFVCVHVHWSAADKIPCTELVMHV